MKEESIEEEDLRVGAELSSKSRSWFCRSRIISKIRWLVRGESRLEEILEVHLEPDLNNIKTEYPEGEITLFVRRKNLEVKTGVPETISRGVDDQEICQPYQNKKLKYQ